MYKDIITYTLAKDIDENHLISIASTIKETWMNQQKGFLKWEIHKNNNGGYTDIVYWNYKEDAKNAEMKMIEIPNAQDWYACYKKGSINSIKLEQVL